MIRFSVQFLTVLACSALIGCGDGSTPPAGNGSGDTTATDTAQGDDSPRATFVGHQTCIECHQQQHDDWVGSHHDLAMAIATPDTVRADFGDTTFEKDGVTTRFFRAGEKFMVHTDGPDGRMADFEVKYTFGVDPLQQYLVEFPDGRVQCLTIAWDTERDRWFTLYPDEKVPHDDWLHWTKGGQNWNYMCAECHSTNLQKNYDLATDTYATTFKHINVTCESCHGPGSEHVKWAKRVKEEDELYDFTSDLGLVVTMKDLDPQVRDPAVQKAQVEVCARCHSRRRIVHPDYRHDRPFLDAYAPQLLREGLYFADGQIQDEVYVYGSFIQSRMYHKGVKCSDCHDAHTAKLRAPGNFLCGQCHDPTKFDTQEHHHHPIGSTGASCVECHMRERTYMQVDPRRDHGFHIPRPDLTLEIGTSNACNACHKDESAKWAADKVVEWYGPKRKEDFHHAKTIAGGRAGKPDAEPRLAALVGKEDQSGIVRATALDLLATRYRTPAAEQAAIKALGDADPLVRGTAAASLEDLSPDEKYEHLTPLLDDPIRFVRGEAARVLTSVANDRFADRSADTSKKFWSALEEYLEGQNATNDRAEAHLNLAVVHERLNERAKAELAYRTAIRLDPTFVPAKMNLAMLLNGKGRKAEAEAMLLDAIRRQPQFAEAHYSLGLLIAENPQRLTEASRYLVEAARLAPSNPRMQYNAGLARQRAGHAAEAEPLLIRAVNLQPQNPDFLYALALLYVDLQRWDRAGPVAQQLVTLYPQVPDFHRLLRRIQSQATAP